MAELFNVTFDLGPDAPVAVVTTAVGDVGVVADTAMDLAQAVAEQEARRYLSELVANEGLRALVSQVRRRELQVAETFERDIVYLERAADEFDLMARELGVPRPWPRRYYRAALLSGLLMPGLPSPALAGAPWHPIVERLVVAEKLDRLPTEGCRVRPLSYANPAEVALIMASGAASAALGYLLTVIAALGPGDVERQQGLPPKNAFSPPTREMSRISWNAGSNCGGSSWIASRRERSSCSQKMSRTPCSTGSSVLPIGSANVN